MGRRRRPALALAFFIGAALCPTASPAGETVTYGYDARGRLVQVSRTGTVNDGVNAAYSYDKADNRTNVTVTTPPTAIYTLVAGQSMWSADGRFQLAMQTDGNLVLYGPDGPLWWTSTNGGADRRMVLQSDGNLIVYDGANQVLWASNTSGNPGAYLVLQNDGNMGLFSSTNAVLWQTSTVYVAPAFAIGDASVTEGGTLTFTVTRDKATSSAYTINYATSNGTATAGSDYNAASGTLTFAPADSSKTISVATIDDSAIEGTETLNVTLSGPSGSATISRATGIGTINDNDAPPACQGVSFGVSSNGAVTEGATSVFTVTKTGTATGSCAVNFATANGTAIAGSDYNANSGTLTFTTAQTSQTVSVTTIDDATVESAETFSLGISGATNGATIGTASATATINDNDAGPCSGVSYAVNDTPVITEGNPLVFTVTKAGSTSSSCAVNYATADGTAKAGIHYTAISGTLTFTSTQTSQTLTVFTDNTCRLATVKLMYLNLSSPSGGATLSDSQGIGSIKGSGSCGTNLMSEPPPEQASQTPPPPPEDQ